jgi:hypothetical protein
MLNDWLQRRRAAGMHVNLTGGAGKLPGFAT